MVAEMLWTTTSKEDNDKDGDQTSIRDTNFGHISKSDCALALKKTWAAKS